MNSSIAKLADQAVQADAVSVCGEIISVFYVDQLQFVAGAALRQRALRIASKAAEQIVLHGKGYPQKPLADAHIQF